MSRITAPVGEVTMPMTCGQKRQLLLALGIKQPLGGEPRSALLQELEQGADPGQLDPLDDRAGISSGRGRW